MKRNIAQAGFLMSGGALFTRDVRLLMEILFSIGEDAESTVLYYSYSDVGYNLGHERAKFTGKMCTTNFECVCVCVCVRECVYLWMYKNIYQKRVRYLCKHPLYTFKTYTDVLNKAKLFTECITKEVLMAWTLLSFTQTELYSREALENLSHPLKDYNSLNTWCQFVSTNRKILTIYTLHFKKNNHEAKED